MWFLIGYHFSHTMKGILDENSEKEEEKLLNGQEMIKRKKVVMNDN